MKYIDFAIAISIFLIFFALVIIFTSNYFSNLGSLTKTSEFRPVAENIFKIFERKGIPENWKDNVSITPVKVGLAEDLYQIPIIITETNGSSRTNEPVTMRIVFDELCQNKSWNNTLRMYDEYDNQINLTISNTTFCVSQFLNQSNVTFDVNISANETKKYFLYYSPDDDITNPNYISSLYNTSSWIPSDRDEWTDNETANFSYWSRNEGVSGSVTNDTINKVRGNSCMNITGNFSADNSDLGLKYDPDDNITGISNGWYVDVWLYLDDTSSLMNIFFLINDNSDTIYVNLTGNITNTEWYHLEKELSSTAGWSDWSTFDASNGIDQIVFNATNTTSGLTRTFKIDGLHFKKKPLNVKTFPERQINIISSSKFDAMKNLNYDDLKKTIGENYNFRIEIDGDTYGGNINLSSNVGCYESPKTIEFTNGTVSRVINKVCVWK